MTEQMHTPTDAPKPWAGEYDTILAMCKAHDREDASQKGEPSPWNESGEADEVFVHERLWAMHDAFEIAKAHFAASSQALDIVAELDRLANKAWMPMRAFRSEHEAELDAVRRETWVEAADAARAFLSQPSPTALSQVQS